MLSLYDLRLVANTFAEILHRGYGENAQAYQVSNRIITLNNGSAHRNTNVPVGQWMNTDQLDRLLRIVVQSPGGITVLTGAGIRALPIPPGVNGKAMDELLADGEWRLLHCPNCGGLTRRHVLWFDEVCDAKYYFQESALKVAAQTAMLIVAGSSGGTNLPNRIVAQVYHDNALIIDINPGANSFADLAAKYDHEYAVRDTSGVALPLLVQSLAKLARL